MGAASHSRSHSGLPDHLRSCEENIVFGEYRATGFVYWCEKPLRNGCIALLVQHLEANLSFYCDEDCLKGNIDKTKG
jgi:hypothetical protein